VFRVWRNDILLIEDTESETLKTAKSYARAAQLFTFYSSSGSPVTQSTFVDDVVITNQTPANRDADGNPFIGMGAFEPPPQTETGAPSVDPEVSEIDVEIPTAVMEAPAETGMAKGSSSGGCQVPPGSPELPKPLQSLLVIAAVFAVRRRSSQA
jgi:hypothetical protein